MKYLLLLPILIFANESMGACANYGPADAGEIKEGIVAKVEVKQFNYVGDIKQMKLVIYYSSYLFNQQPVTCKYIESSWSNTYPGDAVVTEWARMATIAQSLNYYLNYKSIGNILSTSASVTLEKPETE